MGNGAAQRAHVEQSHVWESTAANRPAPDVSAALAARFMETDMDWQHQDQWNPIDPETVVNMLVRFARDMVLLDRTA